MVLALHFADPLASVFPSWWTITRCTNRHLALSGSVAESLRPFRHPSRAVNGIGISSTVLGRICNSREPIARNIWTMKRRSKATPCYGTALHLSSTTDPIRAKTWTDFLMKSLFAEHQATNLHKFLITAPQHAEARKIFPIFIELLIFSSLTDRPGCWARTRGWIKLPLRS